jgi:hypothetical protein
MTKPKAGDFKDMLKNYIKNSSRTSYGNNELQLLIEELYSSYIEVCLEDQWLKYTIAQCVEYI